MLVFSSVPKPRPIVYIHRQNAFISLAKTNFAKVQVYYTFGPVLLERAVTRHFESIRLFLLPLPLNTSSERVIEVMNGKLNRRATDSPEKIRDRSSSAPMEIEKASTYTHRLVNSAGEDDVAEWRSFGTCEGEKGQGEVNSIEDLGPSARWLVETFVKILNGELPPGDYSRETA